MAGDDGTLPCAIDTQLVVRADKASELISLLIGCGFTVRCPNEVDAHHPFAISGTFESVRSFLAAAVDAGEHYHPGVLTHRLVQ